MTVRCYNLLLPLRTKNRYLEYHLQTTLTTILNACRLPEVGSVHLASERGKDEITCCACVWSTWSRTGHFDSSERGEMLVLFETPAGYAIFKVRLTAIHKMSVEPEDCDVRTNYRIEMPCVVADYCRNSLPFPPVSPVPCELPVHVGCQSSA